MQEYVYYHPDGLDFPLDESIYVTKSLDEQNSKKFLISNSDKTNCEVVAKEIDFYIKNSLDSFADKIKNIKKLYDVSALRFDNSKDVSYSKEIGNKLLLIGNIEECDKIKKRVAHQEFDMYQIDENVLDSISGSIGELKVKVKSKDSFVELSVDQIVWFGAKEEGLKQSGTYDPNIFGIEKTLQVLRDNVEFFEYRKFVVYDKSICQYHERRDSICGKCEEVCPSVAITKDETNRHLVFSHVDCHGCGGCVSVCPSGAMDYAPSDRASIYEISQFYKNTHPLILPNKMDVTSLSLNLKSGVLPFAIEGEKFLDESTLLTIAQVSSSQIIFYSDFISKGTGDSIRILNDVCQKIYGKDVVVLAKNEDELIKALENVSFIEGSYFNINQNGMKKREVFSARLSHMVGNNDFGVVNTGEHIHYAQVHVNESKCTLCLSCVGACNVDALYADSETFELKINPSVCTACGYCELSCPEKECLSIEKDVIKLNADWFKFSVLAKDKLFACVECGKEFATVKAIERVATIMTPMFSSNPVKLKTLYACEDCKPKIMIKEGLLNA